MSDIAHLLQVPGGEKFSPAQINSCKTALRTKESQISPVKVSILVPTSTFPVCRKAKSSHPGPALVDIITKLLSAALDVLRSVLCTKGLHFLAVQCSAQGQPRGFRAFPADGKRLMVSLSVLFHLSSNQGTAPASWHAFRWTSIDMPTGVPHMVPDLAKHWCLDAWAAGT
jgi:hypothetical protein